MRTPRADPEMEAGALGKRHIMISWFNKKPEIDPRPYIAVVDDEDDVCSMLRTALEALDCRVETASDGEAGLALVRSQRPDLLLLDIKMPRINGYQMLAQLQQDPALADMPVVLISSVTCDDTTADEEWRSKLGVQGFISKPFDPVETAGQLVGRLKTNGFKTAHSQES